MMDIKFICKAISHAVFMFINALYMAEGHGGMPVHPI
jgi:hypothetical protein